MSEQEIRLTRIEELEKEIYGETLTHKETRILLEELMELRLYWDLDFQPGKICNVCFYFKHLSLYKSDISERHGLTCKLCRLKRNKNITYTNIYCKSCDCNLLVTSIHPINSVVSQHNKTLKHKKKLIKNKSVGVHCFSKSKVC